MNNKTKRVSINQFEKAIDKNNILKLILEGTDDVEFEVQKTIPLDEAISFVNEVVESCIDSDEASYVPESYDFAIRIGVINYYSNLKLPTSIDKQYDFIYRTPAYYQILENINKGQYSAIIKAIDEKITYMKDMMVSTASGKIIDLLSKFNELSDISGDLSKNVNPALVSQIYNAMNQDGILEDKLISNEAGTVVIDKNMEM